MTIVDKINDINIMMKWLLNIDPLQNFDDYTGNESINTIYELQLGYVIEVLELTSDSWNK